VLHFHFGVFAGVRLGLDDTLVLTFGLFWCTTCTTRIFEKRAEFLLEAFWVHGLLAL
jgi:hypothetical protein